MVAAEKTGPARFGFTKSKLEAVKCPDGKDRVYVYDERVPGLAFCVTTAGARAFYLYRKVGGKPERIRLGGYPELTIDLAREKAADLNGQIARGVDPQEQKRAARGEATLGEVWKRYEEKHRPMLKPATWAGYANRYEVHLKAWENRRLSDITHEAVTKLHRQIGAEGPYVANRVLALLSVLFNDAKVYNPAKGVKRFREQSRKRFLTEAEFPKFWAAVEAEPDPTLRDFFKLALLTGARRGNVQAMRWDQLDLTRGVWSIPDTKANEPQDVHLSAQALAILAQRKADAEALDPGAKRERATEWVLYTMKGKGGHLTEPKGAWAKLLTRAGLEDLHIHDLRRTLGSWAAATGASLPIIGRALGHKHEGTTKVYARLNLDPVKGAVDLATAAMLATVVKAGGAKEGGSNA